MNELPVRPVLLHGIERNRKESMLSLLAGMLNIAKPLSQNSEPQGWELEGT